MNEDRGAASLAAPPMTTEAMATTLDQLRPGESAVIQDLQGEPEENERFLEMGLIAGTPLKVVRYAPLGDPMEVLLRGYHFSLRRVEAARVVVRRDG